MKIIIGGQNLSYLSEISQQIESEFYNIEVVCFSDSADVLLTKIKKLQPDVLILQYRLKEGTSFDLLDKIDKRNFVLVFQTDSRAAWEKANTKYQARYLLQEYFKIKDFHYALEIIYEWQYFQVSEIQNSKTVNEITKKQKPEIIEVPSKNKKIKINTNDILYIRADGSYSEFVLKNREIMVSKNLKNVMLMLNDNFQKIHRSFAVNLNYPEIEVAKDCSYIKISDKKIPVSIRKIYELAKRTKSIQNTNNNKIDSRHLAFNYFEEKTKKKTDKQKKPIYNIIKLY